MKIVDGRIGLSFFSRRPWGLRHSEYSNNGRTHKQVVAWRWRGRELCRRPARQNFSLLAAAAIQIRRGLALARQTREALRANGAQLLLRG